MKEKLYKIDGWLSREKASILLLRGDYSSLIENSPFIKIFFNFAAGVINLLDTTLCTLIIIWLICRLKKEFWKLFKQMGITKLPLSISDKLEIARQIQSIGIQENNLMFEEIGNLSMLELEAKQKELSEFPDFFYMTPQTVRIVSFENPRIIGGLNSKGEHVLVSIMDLSENFTFKRIFYSLTTPELYKKLKKNKISYFDVLKQTEDIYVGDILHDVKSTFFKIKFKDIPEDYKTS